MAQSTGFPIPRAMNTNSRNLAEEWKQWQQRFDIYMVATEVTKKPDAVQVAIFLSCIGEEAVKIYNTFVYADGEDRNKLNTIRKKFSDYFTPRRNVVFERYQFWRLTQAAGESIDAFVTKLRLQAQSCEFGEQETTLMRDRIVLTCPDSRLQERLLREADLTLDKALALCRAAETTQQQLRAIKTGSDQPSSTLTSIEAVSSQHYATQRKTCGNCGTSHLPKACPAYGKDCSACHKRNHFAAYCRSSKYDNRSRNNRQHRQRGHGRYRSSSRPRTESTSSVSELVTTELHDSLYIGELSVYSIDSTSRGTSWWQALVINGTHVNCKLDSGAEANVMSAETYKTLQAVSDLQPTATTLSAYNNSRITPLGIATLTVKHKGKEYGLEFFIVAHDAATILGLPSCSHLDILRRVDAVIASPAAVTESSLLDEYAEVFSGLGRFPGEYHIALSDDAVPVIHPPRRVPLALQARLKQTLDAMERDKIIIKRDEPTDWVNSLLVVEKKNKTLRLCLDPRDLNRYIKREHFLIPTCDDVTAHLHGKRIFSVIDMKDSFWQVVLDEESSKLCTFNTPFGRYSFGRLPFGVSCAPEVMQKKNILLFGDIPSVHVVFDDIIIAADSEQEHDHVMRKVLQRARKHHVRFNKDKLQYKVAQVKYVGHVLSAQGVSPDGDKVRAIVDMPTPANAQDLSRFIGMANYLSKFVPNFSSVTQPLRELLKNDVTWSWSTSHQAAFQRLKELIVSAPVLRYFNTEAATLIQTDASSTGLGCCLLQEGHPVAFASRALTDAETRYAQIEKELLAIVFACNKFSQFIYGSHIVVHSDHKPLEAIFKKSVSQTTPRLQRMLLSLLKYDFEVKYKPGKEMFLADTLSRAYVQSSQSKADVDLAEDIDVTVHTLLHDSALSPNTLVDLKAATDSDVTLSQLRELVRSGCPKDVTKLPPNLRRYLSIIADVHEVDGVLLHEGQVIIPTALQPQMLAWVHEGHQGREKSKTLARSSMFWFGMAKDIDSYVEKCAVCISHRNQQSREPLLPHPVPDRPWQRLGADIFTLFGKDYLLVVDYYSKYPEVCLLNGKTALSVVTHLKSVFSRHGIPEQVVADNMPFDSLEMRNFAAQWNFVINTSSPHFSQSNGQAERCIQSIKRLLLKAEESGTDPYIALMQYRATPNSGLTCSPSQLLFGRRLRTKLPATAASLSPSYDTHKAQIVERQQQQKTQYDRRGTRPLSPLKPGDNVRVRHKEQWIPARVIANHSAPRSYIVETENGSTLRRNRRHLLRTQEPASPPIDNDYDDIAAPPSVMNTTANIAPVVPPAPPSTPAPVQTRSGRVVKPTVRFSL